MINGLEMMKTKQVIVIRKDLKMRKGKMVSQGSHASMKVFFDIMYLVGDVYSFLSNKEMKEWIEGLFIKITCGVDSLEELEDLYEKAKKADLPCSKITDAGLTEFAGVPTVTAIAIGPAKNERIDPITKDLKLL